MFIIKRNQVIVTALVVMIAVAGYLNFTDSKSIESGKNIENAMMMTDDEESYSAIIPEGDITTLADDADEDIDVANKTAMDPITAEVVNSDIVTAEAEGEKDDTGAAVFVSAEGNTVESSTYFVQAKLDREQARAKEKDILTEMINNSNIEQTKKSDCADSMLEIQKRIEKETAAEAMIEAKGFKESYVRIDDETVDVVVDKSELTEAEVAQIMDIVKRKTGFTEDKIRISPLKK